VTAAATTHENLFYPESRFGGFTAVDGTVAFYTRVQSILQPHHMLLDFGCGRGAHQEDAVSIRRTLRQFQGRVAKVCGVDVDAEGAGNPFLDEFRLLQPSTPTPYPDATFDVIVADCVVEHLADPAAFFAEMRRLLKPGGHLCIRTSNQWSYIGLAARLVPNRKHAQVLGHVQADRRECDVFPTFYRANSLWSLRRWLRTNGFDHAVYGHDCEPRYLEFSRLAYWMGVLHQRFAPSWLRPALFAFAKKP
jgi:SAM-dependent methyltransferase